MQQTVVGFFQSADDARRAAESLRGAGFLEQDIDISSDTSGSYNSSTERSSDNTPYGLNDESRYGNDQHTAESSRRDTLNEDRVAQRRSEGGDFGDSIGRFFRNLFDNKEEAEHYATVGRSSCIVSVYAESSAQAERARDILDESGAFDVDDRETSLDATDETRTATSPEMSSTNLNNEDQNQNRTNREDITDRSIPVIEENINVGKREVSSGGVRLRSRIFERPVEENLRLREERVRVERVPADRPATESDLNLFSEGEIEVTETSEVPIVNKEARVVEEVKLKKDVNHREETVRDTVRKQDVEVDKLSDEERSRRDKI